MAIALSPSTKVCGTCSFWVGMRDIRAKSSIGISESDSNAPCSHYLSPKYKQTVYKMYGCPRWNSFNM